MAFATEIASSGSTACTWPAPAGRRAGRRCRGPLRCPTHAPWTHGLDAMLLHRLRPRAVGDHVTVARDGVALRCSHGATLTATAVRPASPFAAGAKDCSAHFREGTEVPGKDTSNAGTPSRDVALPPPSGGSTASICHVKLKGVADDCHTRFSFDELLSPTICVGPSLPSGREHIECRQSGSGVAARERLIHDDSPLL